MRNKFKVQEILEKVEVLEVNGQEPSYNCLHNCKRLIWSGNSSSRTKGCYQREHADAYRYVEY